MERSFFEVDSSNTNTPSDKHFITYSLHAVMIDKYGYAVIIDLGFGTYITFTAKDYNAVV